MVAASKTADAVKVSVEARSWRRRWRRRRRLRRAGIEVGFYPSSATWDGRFANNGWLQEAAGPDHETGLGQRGDDQSPKMARDQKLTDGDVISLSRGNFKMEAAVMIQPGHADDAVSIALGYGRQMCGRVGKDVGLQRESDPHVSDGYVFRAGVCDCGHRQDARRWRPRRSAALATTQRMTGRWRAKSLSTNTRRTRSRSRRCRRFPRLHSIYPEVTYDKGNQWGMAIDLTSCTGCNACVMACMAENNIPVVGKDQVLRGREMHWIRMDRYYSGDENDPEVVEQPIPCMQCENAPCENVCPVQATTHSPEGLNDMAYNRCVGTRYCANNCPFKVRHFNFLNFHTARAGGCEVLVYNPDVTVRMRGVMEKCTYCVQRIQETKITAKMDGRREIKDGEIKTACQQTCPADAIVFGNINDPNSRVVETEEAGTQLRDAGGARHQAAHDLPGEAAQSQSGVNCMSAVLQDPQLMEVNPPLVRSEDYHDLTEQISAIVEGDVVKTPMKYWITLAITASDHWSCWALMLAYLVSTGIGVWGNNQPDRLGVGHHELRVLDRYRPRRHADLGDSVSVPAEVENVDQPLGRSDDVVRRDVRGHLPAVPYGASVARVLAVPDSEHRPESCGRTSAAR